MSAAADRSPGRSRLRAAAPWLLGLAGLLLLYALAGFLLVPHLVRRHIVEYVEQDLGRRVAIGEIRFNPFTLNAEIGQFALNETDGSPLVSFARLRVGASLSTLWRRAWSLRELRLDQPDIVALIAADGTLNLSKLRPPAAGTQARASTPASTLPAVRIDSFSIHDGRVRLEDRSRAQPLRLIVQPIELELSDFRTAPGFENRLRFSARTDDGAQLSWSGAFSLQPFGSSGELSVSALTLARIAAYAGDALPLKVQSGSAELSASYHYEAGGAESLEVTSLKIHQLALAPRTPAPAEPAGPWITVPELDVAGAMIDLAHRRLTVHELSLDQAALEVWREADGTVNWQRWLPTTSTAAAPASTAAVGGAPGASRAASAWALSLERLAIHRASIEAQDRSVKPVLALRLSALDFELRDYSSLADKPMSLMLRAEIGPLGRLQASGTVALAPRRAQLALRLDGFDLSALQPYMARVSAVTLYRGSLATKLQFNYAEAAAAGQPQLALAGDIEVANFATRDALTNSELINWRTLALTGLHYQRSPDALHIERVALRGAYGRVIIAENGSLNIATLLRSSSAPGSASAPGKPRAAAGHGGATVGSSGATTASSMPISIDRVELAASTANFTDHSVKPTFSAAILGLNGSVVGLSSQPSSRAKVQLAGKVERYAPVSITGELNVLSATTYTDIGINFSDIDLTIFNPYSGKFAGYAIAQGKLSTQMHYHVENRKLEASHHIVIDQLEFGAATESKQAVPLPVKLAAALLKDRNGVISIDLPVSGSIDDPSFRIAPLIWKALLGLARRIVTAPFSWIGSLFGGGEQLAYVDFPAGSSALAQAEQHKIAQLAKALSERPALKLDIPLHAVGVADDRALAALALEQAVSAQRALAPAPLARRTRRLSTRSAANALPPASPRRRALEALYRQQFQAEPEYPQPSAPSAPAPAAVQPVSTLAPSAPTDTEAMQVHWLEQQLLPRYVPSGSQRSALGRARADAAEAAVVAAEPSVPPSRLFLTDRATGAGGADGQIRMQLQLQ